MANVVPTQESVISDAAQDFAQWLDMLCLVHSDLLNWLSFLFLLFFPFPVPVSCFLHPLPKHLSFLLLTFDLQMKSMLRSRVTRPLVKSWILPSLIWPHYRRFMCQQCLSWILWVPRCYSVMSTRHAGCNVHQRQMHHYY